MAEGCAKWDSVTQKQGSSRDFAVVLREFRGPSRDFGVVPREFRGPSRDFEVVSREFKDRRAISGQCRANSRERRAKLSHYRANRNFSQACRFVYLCSIKRFSATAENQLDRSLETYMNTIDLIRFRY
ncbi:hypothetical protein [Lentibacillus sp. CBA3610]|uniref:hypothetical protein n=1 Tax=Lentibacillus sp. CBA3610 TaxID=2518176 RepID=UPI001595EB1B|nr:hypothetical protein [Lentibacillus sp. CBA3610]QKY68331.1 hypothetical protein Len3610_00685 [Lentibacillus sp. CBA3610]